MPETMFAALRAALLALLLLCALPAAAQQAQGQPDYNAWQVLAGRAESVIDADRASDEALESLRTQIADFRQRFTAARDTNAERIATVRSQIAALGPVPDGGQEDADIAARRTELNEQLRNLRAPVLVAEEAFNQAAGLVSEIDRLIRDRQAEALLSLGPSPVNPANWPVALRALRTTVTDFTAEISSAWTNSARQAEFRNSLPLVALLSLVGLVLLTRGRTWAEMIGDRLRDIGGAGSGLWTFAVSLLRIILPLLGLLALTRAVTATGFAGYRGSRILEALPYWGLLLLGFRWLCDRLFAKNDDEALLHLSPERRTEGRFYGTLLAILLVLRDAVVLIGDVQNITDAARVVIVFPILVCAGLILLRLGQILTRLRSKPDRAEVGTEAGAETEDARAASAGFERAVRLFGRAAMLTGLLAPAMAAIGYAAAGNALLFPMVHTLALFGVVLVVQRLVSDFYIWITGQGTAAREALVPVLIGFVLILAALPPLALIWGARRADLIEVWSQFRAGFDIGGTRISPTDFLTFAVIFTLGYFVTRLVQGALRTNLLPKTKIDAGGQTAIISGVGYIGIFLAALISITGAGIDLSSLAIVAGALSVGIGFGLQTIVSNFVSGIILLIERPVAKGDWIEVGSYMGIVKDISVRSTHIETFDRTDVIVPNADLISSAVINWTRGSQVGRVIVPVGVAYGNDTRRVEAILREIATGHPMVLLNPPPGVDFMGFGADSLDFRVRAIIRDVNTLVAVRSEINHQIVERFTEEGIEIPFAQRDIWLRNPEALQPTAPQQAKQGAEPAQPVKTEGKEGS